MRRISLFLILCLMLVLSFGLAHGQDNAIYVSSVANSYGPNDNDTVGVGGTITWTIAFRVGGSALLGSNNGFIVYSPDGASWALPILDTLNLVGPAAPGWKARYDGTVGKYHAPSNNGLGNIAGADTVGIGSFNIFGIGFLTGFDFPVVTISTGGFEIADTGMHICLDSSGYDVNSEWLWSSSDTKPSWSGQLCYTIFNVPNQGPNITNCVASLSLDHCPPLKTKQFTALDPDTLGADPTFIQTGGPGTTTLAGLWSYQPTLADVGVSYTLIVRAQDDPGNFGPACEISLNFTNICPSFTDGCGDTVAVGKGNSANADVDAISGDCETVGYSLGTPVPAPVGTYSINSTTGTVTFNSALVDGGSVFSFPVIISDGLCADTCNVYFNVLVVEPYTIVIEKNP